MWTVLCSERYDLSLLVDVYLNCRDREAEACLCVLTTEGLVLMFIQTFMTGRQEPVCVCVDY